MKIKALAALCKAAGKVAFIFKENDMDGKFVRQYISEGHAIYPADDLPEMNEELLLTIFDVPGKDKEDWHVSDSMKMPDINFDPYAEGEEPLEDSKLNFQWLGRYYKILFSVDRTVFIDPKLIKPTDDVKENREYYLRRSGNRDYVIVKYGFIVQAVILAENLISDVFMKEFSRLFSRCRTELALSNMEAMRKEMEAEAQEEGIPGQQDFDPETGEILEGNEDEVEH